jgi:glycosyltransferase involved in cell wall biosynthesis
MADWTMALELADNALGWRDDKILVMHGVFEDRVYKDRIINLIDNKKILLSEGNLSQNEYDEMVFSADVGLALYKARDLNTYNMSSGKIMQYMRCGLPVITMKWPSLTEIIDKFDIGKCIEKIDCLEPAIDEVYLKYKNDKKRICSVYNHYFNVDIHLNHLKNIILHRS